MRIRPRFVAIAFFFLASTVHMHASFFFTLLAALWPDLFPNVDLLSLLSPKRLRVAWAVHRTGDFFLKLGQPSAFGSWASYGQHFESKMYNHWFRIDKRTFRLLHGLIKNDPSVSRQDTKFRKCVPSDKRLAMTHVAGTWHAFQNSW